MADRQFLFVNKDMIDRINEGRGELSQNEFIRRCVDRFLGGEKRTVVTRRPRINVWRDDAEVPKKPRKRALDKNSFMFMDEDLLERIDENRGDMSRAEFIQRSINARVPKVVVRESADYATKEEFQEFRRFVKNTLKDLADILFHSNGSSKVDKYLDAPYRPRRRYDEAPEYEDTRPPAPRPRLRSREYYEDDYRPPRRYSRRPSERRYTEDREREESSYRRSERSDRYPSEERRESRDYPPPAREREVERPPREPDYSPPPPPPQEVREIGTRDSLNVRGMLNGLKTKLSNWLFTQDEPEPAGGGYPQTPTQRRYNDYDSSHRDVSRHEVSRYDVTRHETVIRDAQPVAEVTEEEPESQNMHPGLWGLAILLFGFGDTLLSTMVFAKGGYEANPLMGGLVNFFGGSIVSFVIIKTVIMGVLALISFKVFRNQGWLIPSILIVVGAFLVLSNFMAYIKL